jgi:hypothetical protein
MEIVEVKNLLITITPLIFSLIIFILISYFIFITQKNIRIQIKIQNTIKNIKNCSLHTLNTGTNKELINLYSELGLLFISINKNDPALKIFINICSGWISEDKIGLNFLYELINKIILQKLLICGKNMSINKSYFISVLNYSLIYQYSIIVIQGYLKRL